MPKKISYSCNGKEKIMGGMRQGITLAEMSAFSQEFKVSLKVGKYTNWADTKLVEEMLFGLILLVGEYGYHAFSLREMLEQELQNSHYSRVRVRAITALKMLAKMVLGQRLNLEEMKREIVSSYRRYPRKVLDNWPLKPA
ncbi:MAG: hypothetical protein HC877_21035 [Thioploca sp.]|nr:hypothetical protein [Thioploca sp.]